MSPRLHDPALSRRRFLAAAAAPLIVPASVLGRGGAVAPSDRIAAGIIGLGDRGNAHFKGLMSDPTAEVVAVCDVFLNKAKALASRKPGCAALQDFRELIARPDLDAVFISAPENWHAAMSIAAMQAGKDVYCEKALTLTVREGRAVCDAVRGSGRVFQAGTQQRSDARFRFACELARNGYLGRLHTVSVGVPGGRKLPVLPRAPVPEDLDYDLWLGPAPLKPYRDGLCTYNWYFVTDYCAGWIQSWGVHHVDIALWGAPELHTGRIQFEGTATFPDEGAGDVSYQWSTRIEPEKGPTLLFCSDDQSKVGDGVRFHGDKGWVHVTRGGINAEPKSLLGVKLTPGDTRLYASDNHQSNFLACMRDRREPAAPAEACHRATALTLAADAATRARRKLVWDWTTEQIVGDDEAGRLMQRTMRAPWTV